MTMVADSRTTATTIFSVNKRQGPVVAAFFIACAQWVQQSHFHVVHQEQPCSSFLGFKNYYESCFGGITTTRRPAKEGQFCICNGAATNIHDSISLSSPFFKVNDFFIHAIRGNNSSCCDGMVPDSRKHVFFSVAHLAYGHFVFNGVAPLWDKLRSEGLLVRSDTSRSTTTTRGTRQDDEEDQKNDPALVLHVIAGQRNDIRLEQSYVREYLELFGGEVNTYSRSSFLQQSFFLRSRPILGLANVSLDHYNKEASSQLWKDFREFLIQGFPQLRERYYEEEELVARPGKKFLRRVTIIQRQENRRFPKLNATIADMQGILQQKKTEMSFTIQVVQFENMSVVDQATVVSETDILIGADGTGIMNGIFLPGNKSCVIAILPYGVRELIPEKGQNFATLFAKLGIKYVSLESSAVGQQSHKIYHMAKAKTTPRERWFMLKQNLNVSAHQLVSAIKSCLA